MQVSDFVASITPRISKEAAKEIASTLDLRNPPAAFYSNPYPVYAALREFEPVRLMPDGSVLITRYKDLIQVYKDAHTFSSDKKIEFTPKFGDAPHLLEPQSVCNWEIFARIFATQRGPLNAPNEVLRIDGYQKRTTNACNWVW